MDEPVNDDITRGLEVVVEESELELCCFWWRTDHVEDRMRWCLSNRRSALRPARSFN